MIPGLNARATMSVVLQKACLEFLLVTAILIVWPRLRGQNVEKMIKYTGAERRERERLRYWNMATNILLQLHEQLGGLSGFFYVSLRASRLWL